MLVLGLAPGALRADDEPAAAGEIGRSIFVANEVEGQAGEAPAKQIAVNDDIVFNEDITTGAEAKTIVEFRDGSTFEVGPDAVVRIDSFVFNPEESTSHKTLQVTRGVFRYVSGYVSGDQEAKIVSPSGALAIRGSVASGIVDPDLPDFVYVGEGSATFTNSAGSTTLQPGNAIAVPSATAAPMPPSAMPAPVAAQALAVIERRLPPREALRNRPTANEAWLRRQGAADLVPAADQARRQGGGRPMPRPAAHGSLAGELGLLTEGNRVGLFHAGGGARTAEQTAFIQRAAREHPQAALFVQRHTGEARVLHTENRAAGTRMVIGNVGRAAPSAEVMRKVTAASVRANPAAAAQIRQHASQSFHPAEPGRHAAPAALPHPPERRATPAPREPRQQQFRQRSEPRGAPAQQQFQQQPFRQRIEPRPAAPQQQFQQQQIRQRGEPRPAAPQQQLQQQQIRQQPQRVQPQQQQQQQQKKKPPPKKDEKDKKDQQQQR